MAEIGKDLAKAKRLLETDELVAIPTETVYGLAGNALSAKAITKIFQAKDRPFFDPLIVHVPDFDAVHLYAEEIPDLARQLAKQLWPGPLTLLLKRKAVVPDLITAGMDTVGLRCPQHPLTLELLKSLAFPLAAPSANPFGYVSPTQPEHVDEQLGRKIPYILDGGTCRVGIESTIVGFEGDKVVVYRMGGVSVEVIEAIAGPVRLMTHSTSNPKAPGQLKSHYAPRKKLLLGDIEQNLLRVKHQKIGALVFQRAIASIPRQQQIVLSPYGNLEEAAQNLFASLRALDKMDIDLILAEPMPHQGLGRAMNDRLRRAAAE